MPYRISLKIIIFFSLFALITRGHVQAEEADFGYLYGSQTLEEGESELSLWETIRLQKKEGDYRAWEHQLELEHGITDRLQASIYLTAQSLNFEAGALAEDPKREMDRELDLNGVKLALMYNLLDVKTSPVGLSFYVEPTYSSLDAVSGAKIDQYGLEFKTIFQKNFLDEQLVAVYNLVLEPEREQAAGETENEMELQHVVGASYVLSTNWSAGFEGRYKAQFLAGRAREFSTYSLGPHLQYSGDDWFASITWLPQLSGAPASGDEGSNGLHFAEAEKNEIRLKVGFEF